VKEEEDFEDAIMEEGLFHDGFVRPTAATTGRQDSVLHGHRNDRGLGADRPRDEIDFLEEVMTTDITDDGATVAEDGSDFSKILAELYGGSAFPRTAEEPSPGTGIDQSPCTTPGSESPVQQHHQHARRSMDSVRGTKPRPPDFRKATPSSSSSPTPAPAVPLFIPPSQYVSLSVSGMMEAFEYISGILAEIQGILLEFNGTLHPGALEANGLSAFFVETGLYDSISRASAFLAAISFSIQSEGNFMACRCLLNTMHESPNESHRIRVATPFKMRPIHSFDASPVSLPYRVIIHHHEAAPSDERQSALREAAVARRFAYLVESLRIIALRISPQSYGCRALMRSWNTNFLPACQLILSIMLRSGSAHEGPLTSSSSSSSSSPLPVTDTRPSPPQPPATTITTNIPTQHLSVNMKDEEEEEEEEEEEVDYEGYEDDDEGDDYGDGSEDDYGNYSYDKESIHDEDDFESENDDIEGASVEEYGDGDLRAYTGNTPVRASSTMVMLV
jgi:hypothetical protein